MNTDVAQRWRSGRDSYRPAGETIDPRAYEVAAIPDDRTAKAFVVEHHYAASYPAARYRFGIYRGSALEGVAVFSVPAQPLALACLPGDIAHNAELGRFVLLDHVPANAESWFLARCFEQLRQQGIVGIVSFSDPVERRTLAGETVFGGHIGTIYQATNACYLGRAGARTIRMLPDGTIFHGRAAAKIRKRERGWRYAAAILERFGAASLGDTQNPREWLEHWMPKMTRALRHGGNHKYAWTLQRRDRKHLPASLPYPKMHNPTKAQP
jgi:hypothetical protein